jgi:hypothetical protein
VAGILVLRRIPFIFVTGHRLDSVPLAFADAPVMAKPFDPGALVEAVHELMTD